MPTSSVVKGESELTIGHLAERNRDRFSEDQKEALYQKHNSYKPKAIQKKTYKSERKVRPANNGKSKSN